ncbi:MAG: hydroxymyristoyl-ACP dehydratase [Bacteroidales bacterium]|nr:hydroxymyristoyl-ACP dehydratase [Bacteroidales bacterium]
MASFEKINIPQKPPMVMVDKVIDISGKTTVTSFLICPENVFLENGLFREPGLIENMAQTAAAGVGSKPGHTGKNPPMGFIGGIRNLKINSFPAVGQEIRTSVTVTHEIFDATVVEGTISIDQKIIASCELKIFLLDK